MRVRFPWQPFGYLRPGGGLWMESFEKESGFSKGRDSRCLVLVDMLKSLGNWHDVVVLLDLFFECYRKILDNIPISWYLRITLTCGYSFYSNLLWGGHNWKEAGYHHWTLLQTCSGSWWVWVSGKSIMPRTFISLHRSAFSSLNSYNQPFYPRNGIEKTFGVTEGSWVGYHTSFCEELWLKVSCWHSFFIRLSTILWQQPGHRVISQSQGIHLLIHTVGTYPAFPGLS